VSATKPVLNKEGGRIALKNINKEGSEGGHSVGPANSGKGGDWNTLSTKGKIGPSKRTHQRKKKVQGNDTRAARVLASANWGGGLSEESEKDLRQRESRKGHMNCQVVKNTEHAKKEYMLEERTFGKRGLERNIKNYRCSRFIEN